MPISSSAARRALKFLGRFIRDSTHKIAGDAALAERVIPLLDRCAGRKCRTIASATTRSLHAPEAKCIGRGKTKAPHEFGCKVSVATPVTQPFVLRAKALYGNPSTATRSARSSPR